MPSLAGYSVKARLFWIIGSLLGGAWLVISIPLKPQAPSYNTLEIIATGQKNSQAIGSEVQVTTIRSIDGQIIPLNSFLLGSGWKLHERILIFNQAQPASMKWQGFVNDNLKLFFLSSPKSGKVMIRWNGNEQVIDLYSDKSKDEIITLPTKPVSKFILYLGDILTLSLLLFVVSIWLATRPIKQLRVLEVSYTTLIWYILPIILVYSIYLLAEWPGGMSPDTFEQWNQISTGHFNNWAPVFHTLNIFLLTRIWRTPAIVALAQIIVTGLIVGWGLVEFKRKGTPDWANWITIALFCLIPLFPLMSITLWKDVPYSLAFLALSIIAIKIVFSDGRWLNGKFSWIILGAVSALVALYRHNGPPVALGFLIIAGICYKSYWKKIFWGLLLCVLLWQGVTGPVYNYLMIPKSGTIDALASIGYFGIGAHIVNDPTILSTDKYHYLEEILPLQGWKLYDCHTSNPISSTPLLNLKNDSRYTNKLFGSFVELTLKKPSVTINHFICITSYIWKISGAKNEYYNGTPVSSENTRRWEIKRITDNGYNLQYFLVTLHQTPIPAVRDIIQQMNAWLYSGTSRVLWRPALYLYLMLFSLIVYMIRSRSFAISLVAVPSLIQTGVMLIVSVNSELRYQYPIFLIGLWLFLPLITCGIKRITPKNTGEI